MNKADKSCDICNEINNVKNNFFTRNLLTFYKKYNLETRIIYRNRNFFVIPSIGPVSPCHLLVCPIKHVCSFAQLDYSLLEEGEKFLNSIFQLVQNEYGYAIAFEHGETDKGVGSSSCNHAHIHILAAQISLKDLLNQRGFRLERIETIKDLKAKVNVGTPYFFIITNTGELWITEDTVCQSQYLRILCATELGEKNGLWQNDIGIERMISTNIKFNKYFG